MKILVIGGSGFIGTRLVDELIEKQYSVKIFDIQKSEKYPEITIVGDVRAEDEVTEACAGMDVIYNLAAEHRDDVSPISLYHDVNVVGAKNIITAATHHNTKKIVFTSTVAIYGLDKNCPDESFPAEPFNEYGRSKYAAEQLFQAWATQDADRSLIIFRPAVVFGEGNRGNVYNLIKQIQSGRFLMVGDGSNKKSMGYVGNLAYILSQQTANSGVKVYNYCDKPDLTSFEIAQVISNKLGVNLPKVYVPIWIGDVAGIFFDLAAKVSGRRLPISRIRIRKFSAETTICTKRITIDGFTGKHTIQDGLSRMIDSDFTLKKNLKFD